MQAARPKLTKNGSTPGGKPETGKSVSRMPVILQVNSSGPPQRAGHTVTRHIARVASSTCHAVGPPSQHCHKAYWSGSDQSRANVATFPRMKTLQENEHVCSCFASLVGCTKEKKKKVPVSCKRVFHNALLDCCSQFIAESERAPPVRVETTPEPSHHPAP